MKGQKKRDRDYIRYAEHCVKAARLVPDRKSRIILREMAAEWTKLADARPKPSVRPKKV
jgi:hypothetical protein